MPSRTVGAYEAKTHLPTLLEAAAGGESITITRRGRPVAMLVPPPSPGGPDVGEVVSALRLARRGVTLGDVSLRELIDTGRA